MVPIWVLVADEGRARILELRAPDSELEEVEELTDAGAHADDADLRRDAHGRRAGGSAGATGTMQSASENKLQIEAERFARRVAEHLTQAHRRSRYERLRIAAAPAFLGRLRQQLDDEVRASLIDETDKDYVHLSKRALTHALFPGGAAAPDAQTPAGRER
jgi:protein required for attachment to host cells